MNTEAVDDRNSRVVDFDGEVIGTCHAVHGSFERVDGATLETCRPYEWEKHEVIVEDDLKAELAVHLSRTVC